jgi:microsomal dipeptidase-like Zn-dependent dipeptidase
MRAGFLPILVVCLASACGGDSAAAPLATDMKATRVKVAGENESRTGFADYHAHMFSNLAFGGALFAGEAYPEDPNSPRAAEKALARCRHTSLLHPSTRILVGEVEPRHGRADGFPDFERWPRFDTHLHQQMYIDWVYRSYQYGLRLLSLTITNNEALCESIYHPKPCNDMAVVDLQLAEIERMAALEGDWLRIAHSAAEADEIVRSNRLAVVIAIEVDTLFDCGISRARECSCGVAEVAERLQRYYDRGVRQIVPIHMADNGFGGAALYKELLANNHFLRRGYFVGYYDCFAGGVRWTLRGSKGIPWAAQLSTFLSTGRFYRPEIAAAAAAGHCNALGLTSDCGRSLIREMMRRGMLIDVEHMSTLALEDTLAIAEAERYPVLLSHTWLRDLKLPRERVRSAASQGHPAHDPFDEQRAEMHRSADTIRRIAALGGVVGVLTNQGPVELPAAIDAFPVANDCDGSSRSFAQAFLLASELMGPDGGVGFGSDFNGLAGQPSPRFGADACAGGIAGEARRAAQARGQEAEGARVRYDGSVTIGDRRLTQSQAGNRRFDINQDGLAQYGMLPDFIADLRVSGLPDEALDRLFRSAAAFVQMWGNAESSPAAAQFGARASAERVGGDREGEIRR